MKKQEDDWKILHGFKKPRDLQTNLIGETDQRKQWEERTEKVPF